RSLLGSIVSGLAASARRQSAGAPLELFLSDGHSDDQTSLATWFGETGLTLQLIKPRESETELAAIAQQVHQRVSEDRTDAATMVVIVDPLNRFSDLRQD